VTACGVRHFRNSSNRGADIEIIDRSSVNAFDDAPVARAIEATGRKKLIFGGISLEACAAFPAITAVGKGFDAHEGRRFGNIQRHQAASGTVAYATGGRTHLGSHDADA
jgi:hypothetical protein